MSRLPMLLSLALSGAVLAAPVAKDPTWWDKYNYLLKNGPDALALASASTAGGSSNVDVSNECGPQSETFIAINPSRPRNLAAGSGAASPYRNNVCIGWAAASGGSATGGGVLVARSSDHGATFSIARVDDPSGPGRSIGATLTTGPQGQVYVAWNDYANNTIAFNSSLDGGASWGTPRVIASKALPFDIRIPAEPFRGALVYPACVADISGGAHRGRLTSSWMDLNGAANTD